MNERLRALMRYQGELSRYIDEALTRFDSVDQHSTRRESAWRPVSRSAKLPPMCVAAALKVCPKVSS